MGRDHPDGEGDRGACLALASGHRVGLHDEGLGLWQVALEEHQTPGGEGQRRGSLPGLRGPAHALGLEDVRVGVGQRTAFPPKERQHLEPLTCRAREAQIERPFRQTSDA